jgi:hypothetical protein
MVFCGDGAPWIWSGVEALCGRLGLDRDRVHPVLDYTPAQQNLQAILDLVPPAVRQRHALDQRWKEVLWQGDLAGLREAIEQTLTAKTARQQALKKWRDYFEGNAHRMPYQHFRTLHLPCGSGCVESAIRRVINLRLKAPGTFWTRDMAECFLFLRAQLLSGRWDIVLNNITRQTATRLPKLDDSPVPAPSYPMLQAA